MLTLSVAVLLGVIFFLFYRYSIYAMLVILALVAAMGAFILFDSEVYRLFGSLVFYGALVTPLFVAYMRLDPYVSVAMLWIFAMVSFIVVISIFFLPAEFQLNSTTAELFHLARRYLKRRRFRFIFSLLSLVIFTAGVTSLALFLPFYSLLVPFAIVVCEFAVIMLSNVHERKRDILTLTSVGVNPDNLQGLFLMEAALVGFLGGGIGYALGLSILIVVSLPISGIELSTGWVVVALLASLAASLTASVYPSIKASLIATPSLIRRWRRIVPPYKGWPPEWTIELPVKVLQSQIDSFMRYFHDYAVWLERLPRGYIEDARNVNLYKVDLPGGGEEWVLQFDYIFGEGAPPKIVTRNEIRAVRGSRSKEYDVRLTVKVLSHDNINVYQALERIISTFRQMVLDWTEKATFKTARKPVPAPRTLLL
ncbi:MAG: hypothetical protein AYL32_011050 [Candidatus Bathyarchaeota archaeon B26-2]|nr:MAG: hypothetical protein AYL32_011050 [Candidatus Bathyarchaeota archaeon B26-2]